MEIKRFKVDNYGSIRDRDWDLEPGMNLFFGLNESGKTLLVESMIKMLLPGDTKEFPAIDRVSGNPAGFLVVESDGDSIQIPDANFTDIFPDDAEKTDIRNAFVIRDLDLRIPKRERDFGHSSYLKDVTDRIMGSQTQKIESIGEKIADIGNLASKDSTILMDRAPVKLKRRRNDAEELVDGLRKYRDNCREEGVLRKVREKRVKEEELETVVSDIEDLEKAEKQEKLETGKELVQRLEEVERKKEEHEERDEDVKEHRELRRRIDAHRESESGEDVDLGTYRKASFITIPLFALSLIAAMVSPVSGLGLIAGVLLVIVLYLGYKYFEARGHAVEGKRIVKEGNYAGFEGDDLPTVYNAVDEAIKAHESEGQSLSKKWSGTIGELKGIFEADHESVDEWREEVAEFSGEVEEVDREFDEEEMEQLEGRREALEAKIEKLRRDLQDHRTELSGFDSGIQEIRPEDYLDDEEHVRVKSVEDLSEAIRVLNNFVSKLNKKKDQARTAIDIFDELEEEEEQEINQLFSEDDFIVETFQQVTGDNYTDVRYDEEDSTIRVERADGRKFTPFELSQGTYDLLYLAVRLKLARKLLDGETGFLVLDDAFIHSDAERTKEEIEVLNKLVDEGWQIVYFSFRNAVKKAVSDSDNGNVIELDTLEFT